MRGEHSISYLHHFGVFGASVAVSVATALFLLTLVLAVAAWRRAGP